MFYIKFVITPKPNCKVRKTKRTKPYETVLTYHKGEPYPKRRHWEYQKFTVDAYEVDYKEKYRVHRKVETPYDNLIELLGKKKKYEKPVSPEELEAQRIRKVKEEIKKELIKRFG